MTDERIHPPADEQDTSNTAVETKHEPTGDPSTLEPTSTTKATSTTESTTATEPTAANESDKSPTAETSSSERAEIARANGAEAQRPVRAESSASTAAAVATSTESQSNGPSADAKVVSAPKSKPTVTADKPAAGAAEKPKKAAPPPDPRVEVAKARADELRSPVVKALGEGSVEEVGAVHRTPMIRIRNQNWREAVETLKNHPDWKLNYVECMAGVDYPGYIEIVLYVQSTSLGHFVCLKTRTDRTDAKVPSLASVYPAVNWEEREIYDLLGVHFHEHPDLRRIMMWDEFKGHPLRKDYNEWDSEEEDQGGTH